MFNIISNNHSKISRLLGLLFACLIGLLLSNNAFALSGRVALPVEYIKFMENLNAPTGPANPSPFTPYFDPAPTIFFVPRQAPEWKPYLKTPQEINDFGYIFWQAWATKSLDHELYDPFTGSPWGEEHWYWQWSQSQGYRLTGNGQNIYDGVWWYDSGWMWSGSAAFDRDACGNVIGYMDTWNHPSGYASDVYETRNAQWMFRNWRNTTQKNFEVAIWFPVKSYPYGHHRHEAVNNGTLVNYDTWRIYCVPPGQSIDCTPTYVPRNYELRDWPFLGLDMKSYADNNASLPEWVEGTY